MKHIQHRYTSLVCMAGLAFFFTACADKTVESAGAATAKNALSSIQVIDTKPADALAVKYARRQLKPGDNAVVHGQIGGADQPFYDGYAGFVLGDTEIMFCDEMGDEHCATPWDACCEDSDKLKVSRASVQFVDSEGMPIDQSMKGYAGVKELDAVVVVGTVAATSTPDNLIIEGTGFYVERQ